MDIIAKIKNNAEVSTVSNTLKGVQSDENTVTLLYIVDYTNNFDFDFLPPLFFVTEGGKNDKILVTEITGKSSRQLSANRYVSTLKAVLDLGGPTETKLKNTKVGDCFRQNDDIYLIINRPEKAQDKCVWAVPLSGGAGKTFENDWFMKSVYHNVSINIEADIK